MEAARWMAGMGTDYPEHLDAGLQPHRPKERYYFSRMPQRINRIVDISNYIDIKAEANLQNTTKGPASNHPGKRLWERLAKEGKKLPILGDETMADINYMKNFVFDIDSRRLNFTTESNRIIGERYGLEWAEQFHYIRDLESDNLEDNKLEQYIKTHAIPK